MKHHHWPVGDDPEGGGSSAHGGIVAVGGRLLPYSPIGVLAGGDQLGPDLVGSVGGLEGFDP